MSLVVYCTNMHLCASNILGKQKAQRYEQTKHTTKNTTRSREGREIETQEQGRNKTKREKKCELEVSRIKE